MSPLFQVKATPIPLFRRCVLTLIALTLTACGGGRGDAVASKDAIARSSGSASEAQVPTASLLKQAAAINTAELDRAAQVDSGARRNVQGAKAIERFAGATRVGVVRFYNSLRGTHLYTATAVEIQNVRAMAMFREEGSAFYASRTAVAGLNPVHRFVNTQTGTHFYTISEEEKTFIQERLPSFEYEGVAYHASRVAGTGLVPVRRFYNPGSHTHFYTVSESEANTVRDRLPQYQDEGIAYHALSEVEPPVPPAPLIYRLPHSGVTAAQCFKSGSNALVACSDADALGLNAEQDGHRTAINPMTYSLVPKAGGGTYARTECIRDEITGLIWEGKEAAGSGIRGSDATFTHYDDPTKPQRFSIAIGFSNPTPEEIDMNSNATGYLKYVNSIALCGNTDWRLPTADELQGIVDYGVAYPGPAVDTNWFPNTLGERYWSSSPHADAGDAQYAWVVHFLSGYVGIQVRFDHYAVRLVRAGR